MLPCFGRCFIQPERGASLPKAASPYSMAVNVASSSDLQVEYFLHPDKITGEKTGNQVMIFGQLAENYC